MLFKSNRTPIQSEDQPLQVLKAGGLEAILSFLAGVLSLRKAFCHQLPTLWRLYLADGAVQK